MNEYEFYNELTDDTIEVEADSFEEAVHAMFSDGELNPSDWELVATNGVYG